MKASFIVFEGLDGSGTSTQAQLLLQYYIHHNYQAIISPEPTSGPIGKFIRSVLNQQVDLEAKTSESFDQQMSYLFAADRYYHLYNKTNGVVNLLQNHITVISTRYYFSSFAYHCHQSQDWELVKRLNQGFPPPDLFIYLDIPLAVSLARLETRSQREIYENQQKLTQVKANYEKVLREYTGLKLQLDATETKEAIHDMIVQFIDSKLLRG